MITKHSTTVKVKKRQELAGKLPVPVKAFKNVAVKITTGTSTATAILTRICHVESSDCL